jgi:hypothetical protein
MEEWEAKHPSTNRVRQTISIPPGSYNRFFSNGINWITGVESSVLTAVDASAGKVLQSILVGPKPRFLTSGGPKSQSGSRSCPIGAVVNVVIGLSCNQ